MLSSKAVEQTLGITINTSLTQAVAMGRRLRRIEEQIREARAHLGELRDRVDKRRRNRKGGGDDKPYTTSEADDINSIHSANQALNYAETIARGEL